MNFCLATELILYMIYFIQMQAKLFRLLAHITAWAGKNKQTFDEENEPRRAKIMKII